jgi:hypothetical protein
MCWVCTRMWTVQVADMMQGQSLHGWAECRIMHGAVCEQRQARIPVVPYAACSPPALAPALCTGLHSND